MGDHGFQESKPRTLQQYTITVKRQEQREEQEEGEEGKERQEQEKD